MAGNLTGLMAVSQFSSSHTSSAEQVQTETQTHPQSQPEMTPPAQDRIYDGGTLPEAVVTAQAPDRIYDGGTLPEAVITAEAPEKPTVQIPRVEMPELDPLPKIDIPPMQPVMPDIQAPPDKTPISVEKETFVSYSEVVSSTTHAIDLDISEQNHTAGSHQDASVFAHVQDVEGSKAKLMSMSVFDDGKYSGTPVMHIDENGKVTQLPDWHGFADTNNDAHLSDQEIKDWTEKRQTSLQSVLSEQEARNVAMTEINEEIRNYTGDNMHSVKSEQNSGVTSYRGPADGLNTDAADKVSKIADMQTDKIANAAKDVMCNRIDAHGNACQVDATQKQIQVADILLRSAANKVR